MAHLSRGRHPKSCTCQYCIAEALERDRREGVRMREEEEDRKAKTDVTRGEFEELQRDMKDLEERIRHYEIRHMKLGGS